VEGNGGDDDEESESDTDPPHSCWVPILVKRLEVAAEVAGAWSKLKSVGAERRILLYALEVAILAESVGLVLTATCGFLEFSSSTAGRHD
jgi:hypothetical protein